MHDFEHKVVILALDVECGDPVPLVADLGNWADGVDMRSARLVSAGRQSHVGRHREQEQAGRR